MIAHNAESNPCDIKGSGSSLFFLAPSFGSWTLNMVSCRYDSQA